MASMKLESSVRCIDSLKGGSLASLTQKFFSTKIGTQAGLAGDNRPCLVHSPDPPEKISTALLDILYSCSYLPAVKSV